MARYGKMFLVFKPSDISTPILMKSHADCPLRITHNHGASCDVALRLKAKEYEERCS